MSISDEIKAIKEKYTPKDMKLKPSSFCRNEYARSLGECAKCEMCGRRFRNGELVNEVYDDYGWEDK